MVGLSYNNGNISWSGSYTNSNYKTTSDESLVYALYKDTLWLQNLDMPYRNRETSHAVITSLDWSVSIGSKLAEVFFK